MWHCEWQLQRKGQKPGSTQLCRAPPYAAVGWINLQGPLDLLESTNTAPSCLYNLTWAAMFFCYPWLIMHGINLH